MRKQGKLVVIPGYEGEILDAEQTRLLAFETMSSTDMSTFHHKKFEHDYAFEIEGVGRFRMNVYKSRGATAFVGRLIQNKARSLSELGVPPVVSRLAALHTGIIIVAGATGSGKSTTMAGVIDFINKGRAVHIISIEDPIEIVHTDAMASISQREVGADVDSYESALKAALREDPDVILIGEIRDLGTLKTALLAADTGHLVVTTLHTTDTAETINRILSMYPQGERDNTRRALASALRGIVGQRLVPTLAGGRVVVNEILVNTPEVSDIILDPSKSAKSIKTVIERSNTSGMQSFEQQFVSLVEAGIIDLRTAKENSVNPEYYDHLDIKFPDGFNPETELVVPNISVSKQIPSGQLPHIVKPVATPAPAIIKPPSKSPVSSPSKGSSMEHFLKNNRNPLG